MLPGPPPPNMDMRGGDIDNTYAVPRDSIDTQRHKVGYIRLQFLDKESKRIEYLSSF